MRKLLRFFKGFLALILVLVALLYVTDYDYIIKGVRVVYMTGHTTAYIDDYVHFENDTIYAGGPSWQWPKHKEYNTATETEDLKKVNALYETVAFVIIKNDSIWYENYWWDYGPDSRSNSFSMAKSITTAMLGKAIEDGYIKSLDQKVGDFFDQYANDATTVGHTNHQSFGTSGHCLFQSHVRQLHIGIAALQTQLPDRVFRPPVTNALRNLCSQGVSCIAKKQQIGVRNHGLTSSVMCLASALTGTGGDFLEERRQFFNTIRRIFEFLRQIRNK